MFSSPPFFLFLRTPPLCPPASTLQAASSPVSLPLQLSPAIWRSPSAAVTQGLCQRQAHPALRPLAGGGQALPAAQPQEPALWPRSVGTSSYQVLDFPVEMNALKSKLCERNSTDVLCSYATLLMQRNFVSGALHIYSRTQGNV